MDKDEAAFDSLISMIKQHTATWSGTTWLEAVKVIAKEQPDLVCRAILLQTPHVPQNIPQVAPVTPLTPLGPPTKHANSQGGAEQSSGGTEAQVGTSVSGAKRPRLDLVDTAGDRAEGAADYQSTTAESEVVERIVPPRQPLEATLLSLEQRLGVMRSQVKTVKADCRWTMLLKLEDAFDWSTKSPLDFADLVLTQQETVLVGPSLDYRFTGYQNLKDYVRGYRRTHEGFNRWAGALSSVVWPPAPMQAPPPPSVDTALVTVDESGLPQWDRNSTWGHRQQEAALAKIQELYTDRMDDILAGCGIAKQGSTRAGRKRWTGWVATATHYTDAMLALSLVARHMTNTEPGSLRNSLLSSTVFSRLQDHLVELASALGDCHSRDVGALQKLHGRTLGARLGEAIAASEGSADTTRLVEAKEVLDGFGFL